MTTSTRRHAVYGVENGVAICACGASMSDGIIDAHVTAGNATAAANAAHPTVRATPAGMLVIELSGGRFIVAPDQAEELARSLREAVYAHAPTMTRVLGTDGGDGALDPEQAAAALAEGWDLEHGLACPHDGCDHIAWDDHDADAVYVVDEDERWSSASYQRDPNYAERRHDPTTGSYVLTGGTVVRETVHTGGADTDYQGLGYRCPTCRRPVTLPDGVEEVWV